MDRKPAILVLCTGNSARSQMAEALLRERVGHEFCVFSAGTHPTDCVHPFAVEVLAEKGMDISGQEPKHFEEYLGRLPVRVLIVVCDGAQQGCPTVWPGVVERLHWPFEDPAAFEGTEAEKLQKFREVRDAIEARLDAWVASLQ